MQYYLKEEQESKRKNNDDSKIVSKTIAPTYAESLIKRATYHLKINELNSYINNIDMILSELEHQKEKLYFIKTEIKQLESDNNILKKFMSINWL